MRKDGISLKREMRLSIIPLFLFIHFNSRGQTDTSSFKKDFIEKTIQYYYDPQADGQAKPTFLVLKDTITNYFRTDYLDFNIELVTRDEAVDKISKSKKKTKRLDEIETKWLTKDTSDISIAGWSVSVKKVNEIINGQRIKYQSYFVAGCGGTLGYIPTCRFVYDKSAQSWTQMTDIEIRKQKLALQDKADNSAFDQTDTILINGFKFVIKKSTIKNDYGRKDTLLKLYKLDSGKARYVLKHYLYKFGADAENEFEDIGTIQIHDDSIVLKTHYLQKGFDPIPDWRRRIYLVTPSGKILLLSDKSKKRNSNLWTETDYFDDL